MPPNVAKIRHHPVTLIHHAASSGEVAPPGSLAALENCLKAGAAVIEIDVIPLADGSLALLHEQDLAEETDGAGKAPQMKREQVQDLHYRLDGRVSDEKIGFLEGALELLAAYPKTQRLQLDLKPFTPLTPGVVKSLLTMIEPLKARVQVTSVADWAIRLLVRSAPDLSLGFDPLLYLDLRDENPRPKEIPPFRLGAYGLLDDHPLSAFRWGEARDYFAARAEALLSQVPRGCAWFIRAEVLQMALEAGFDWIEFLHQAGSAVDGWTIDIHQPEQIALAQSLVDWGVDALTTDAPAGLAPHISTGALV